MNERLFIGQMSGTSLDGVDTALLKFSTQSARNELERESLTLQCIATHYAAFAEPLRRELFALQTPGNNELHRAAIAANSLAESYALGVAAVLQNAGQAADAVVAIGSHGQTLRHRPQENYTWQLNNPARLAELTGIPVVADFRSRDLAAGGQGAPLVPAFHQAIFSHPQMRRAIVNIGGISNITTLYPGQPVRGFDCGPGNMLLDAWIEQQRQQAFDKEGAWGASGTVNIDLLARLLAQPFFATPPPKSCGREQFGRHWLATHLNANIAPVDVQATLVALTVHSITHALQEFCGLPDALYVCGGGAHNVGLMAGLAEALPSVTVTTTETIGLPADWVEAAAFAWLAMRCIDGAVGNLPEATGASGGRVLGALYPA